MPDAEKFDAAVNSLREAVFGESPPAERDGVELHRSVGNEEGAKALEAARAAAQAPAQAPAGLMTPEEVAAWEQRPAARSYAEERKRLEELEKVEASLRYHEEQR